MNTQSKTRRLVVSICIGVCIGIVTFVVTSNLSIVPLATWDGLVLAMLLLYLHDFRGHNASETARIARKDNVGRTGSDVFLLIASLVSLGAVVQLLASQDHSLVHVVFALFSIVISWALVHALYMLRYAVMYYDSHDDGIDFSSKQEPSFADFAYVAFTIGMTYQVSDTTFTSTRFRRVALGHALLSFVFGVAIIATSINFVAGLGK